MCALLCPSHTPQAGFILSFKGVLSQNTEAKPSPKLQGLWRLELPLSAGLPSSETAATPAPLLPALGPRATPPIPEQPRAPGPPPGADWLRRIPSERRERAAGARVTPHLPLASPPRQGWAPETPPQGPGTHLPSSPPACEGWTQSPWEEDWPQASLSPAPRWRPPGHRALAGRAALSLLRFAP